MSVDVPHDGFERAAWEAISDGRLVGIYLTEDDAINAIEDYMGSEWTITPLYRERKPAN